MAILARFLWGLSSLQRHAHGNADLFYKGQLAHDIVKEARRPRPSSGAVTQDVLNILLKLGETRYRMMKVNAPGYKYAIYFRFFTPGTTGNI